jgi:hypothetical protein
MLSRRCCARFLPTSGGICLQLEGRFSIISMLRVQTGGYANKPSGLKAFRNKEAGYTNVRIMIARASLFYALTAGDGFAGGNCRRVRSAGLNREAHREDLGGGRCLSHHPAFCLIDQVGVRPLRRVAFEGVGQLESLSQKDLERPAVLVFCDGMVNHGRFVA